MSNYVVLVLIAEVADGSEHGIGSRLAQRAKRRLANHAAQLIQQAHLLAGSAPVGDRIEYAQCLVEAYSAWNALAAGLRVGEFDEVAGHIDHAVVFIHDHHAAGAHDGSDLRQALVINRSIEHLDRDAAAGGAAGLHGLHAASGHGALADVVNKALQRSAQRHLHQAGVLNLAYQRKDLGPRTLLAAGFCEPCWSASDDRGDVIPGLDVVDVGRLAVQALLCGVWRAWARVTSLTFKRCNQSCFLAANEGASALHQLDVEVEAAIQDVHAQKPELARLLDCSVESAHRQRILGAHIDDALGCAHYISADNHAFQQ